VGGPAPLTVTATDCVAGDTKFGFFFTFEGLRGTAIRTVTETVSGAARGVDGPELFAPEHAVSAVQKSAAMAIRVFVAIIIVPLPPYS
jgi:hypothetical protein